MITGLTGNIRYAAYCRFTHSGLVPYQNNRSVQMSLSTGLRESAVSSRESSLQEDLLPGLLAAVRRSSDKRNVSIRSVKQLLTC